MVALIDALFILFVILQAGDFWTTRKVLSQGGREQNPIADWFMGKMGLVPAMLLLKVVAIACAYYLIAFPTVLAALCAFYTYIVVKNYTHIK